jgi:WD40 repeat protein
MGWDFATGSRDKTVCVWSLSSGERLLGPLKYDHWVVAVKFSPDGHLIATATWNRDVQVYDSRNGVLVSHFPVPVDSAINQSLAWVSDSKQLFAFFSRDGNINCLDVSTGTTLSKWAIHSSHKSRCIALGGQGTFIAASANSSVSFWNTATHEQIGSVIEYPRVIWSMAISTNYDLVISGRKKITLLGLCDILPSCYFDSVCVSARKNSREITF